MIKTVEAVATSYGAAALTALRELVAAQKINDPLAPVTILVPDNIAGLSVRRHLVRGVIDGQPGIAEISISTPPWLAEQLAAASLNPRTPATAAAWRTALDEATGVCRDRPVMR